MEKLQCSVCGGALVMSDDGEKAVCESCGMSFKKETVKKMVMELSGPVKVEGIQNSDSLADRAETFLRLGELRKAEEAFRKMADEYPADYRGWWGLTRLKDWNRYFYSSGTGHATMPIECKRALNFAPAEVKQEIQAYFDEQVRLVKPETDRQLEEEAEADRQATERRRQEELQKAEQYRRQADQAAAARQKTELYQQALNAAIARADKARAHVGSLHADISRLPQQIKDLKKMTRNRRTGEDYRPITLGNIAGLFFGGAVTYVVWDEFHPIGTPILTLLGLGLPLLFIARRVLRVKERRAQAAALKRRLREAKAELPRAEEELVQANSALQAVKNAAPV